jgi:hypothetical protein
MAERGKDDVAEQIAQLKAEVEALKSAQPPKPSTFVPMSVAEHQDMVHKMREGRMNYAHHPEVSRYFADGVTAADCADINRAAHAPTGPSAQSAIPSAQPVSNVRGGRSATPGYVDPRPLGPQSGIDLIDRAVNEALPHGPEWGKKEQSK